MTMDVDGSRGVGANVLRYPLPDRAPFRCKLYRLSREDAWEDLGTGFVKVQMSMDPAYLQVVRERDLSHNRDDEIRDLILSCPVLDPGVYHLQGDAPGRETIIVWEDAESRDFALSLENHEDARLVWSVLCGNDKRDVGAIGPPPREKPQLALPKPSLKTLEELVCILNRPLHPTQRDCLAQECLKDEWLRKLRHVFHDAEDIENTEALTLLFHLVKGMFLLARSVLTERLLRKDCWKDFIGMLEFDDGIPAEKRFPHRKILSVEIKYRAVLTFTDEHVLDKIHLNYRMMYLRDHIIPRMIDDSVFLMLLQQIYANTSSILQYIEQSPKLLDQLFSQIKDGDLQSLDFIQDCCRQLRSPGFSQQEREKLYATLFKRDLFGILIPYITKPRRLPLPARTVPHPCSRMVALDIIHMYAYHNPSHLQKYIIQHPPFLAAIVNIIIDLEDDATQSLAAEIVRWLMDFTFSHNPMIQAVKSFMLPNEDKQNFLSILYDRSGPLPALITFFRDSKIEPSVASNNAKQMICEVMATGLQRNEYHSKCFVLSQNFALHAMKLFSTQHKYLHHAAIRVIRGLVKRDDEHCVRYLIKNSDAILKPLMDILEASLVHSRSAKDRTSGNIIVSSILDTVNAVMHCTQKELLQHICETFKIFQMTPPPAQLDHVVVQYNKNQELARFPPSQGYQCGAPSKEREAGASVADENARYEAAYFDGSDEEDQLPTAAETLFLAHDVTSPPHSPEEGSDRKRLKVDMEWEDS